MAFGLGPVVENDACHLGIICCHCDYLIHYRTHSGYSPYAFPARFLAIWGIGGGERLSNSTNTTAVSCLALAPVEAEAGGDTLQGIASQ